MDIRLLPLYFFIGGTIVALASYYGAQGKGMLAAFIAFFPSVSLITISIVYLSGGLEVASSYIKSMLFLIPAWVIYAGTILYLLPHFGLPLSLITGIIIYIIACLLIAKIIS